MARPVSVLTSTNGGDPVSGDPGDIDNRITQVGTEMYEYAPDNKRVVKMKTGAQTVTEATLWVGNMRVGVYRYQAPDRSEIRFPRGMERSSRLA